MRHVPHSRPFLGRAEQRAVSRVIASGLLAEGAEVEAFERDVAAVLGRKYAAAVQSGTAALYLALKAIGVERGDRVAMPSYVCPSLLHAAHMIGARPLLVDVDPDTYNLDPEDLRRRLRARTRAVIVPHMFGLPAELEEILANGVPIIEDCAMSLGARYRGKPVGSCGILSVVSFYATKMIATGEGGMVLGDRADLLTDIRDLRSYDARSRHRPRFNYKMTELQAALGRVQLHRLTNFIRCRSRLASRYLRALAGGPWKLPVKRADHVYYRFVLQLPRGTRRFLSRLSAAGVEARRPVLKPLHRFLGLEGFPGSDAAHQKAVSIPLYPALAGDEADYVIESVRLAGEDLLE